MTISPVRDRALKEPTAGPDISAPLWDIIELLFFAYRDFVSDADDVLAKFGFGRAHHRVLHFVNRNPGMKVADLLNILNITKQSLGRVLKQLIDQGYIVQKEGANDRRQRLLYATPKGEALAMKLPVVARRGDSVAGLLGPNCLTLVGEDEEEDVAFARVVDELLGNANRREELGRIGRELVESNYPVETSREAWKRWLASTAR